MGKANSITHAHVNAIWDKTTWKAVQMGEKTTVMIATLPNGFEIVESSACVDKANYDHQMGIAICQRRVIDRIWQLEGYKLQSELTPAIVMAPAEAAPQTKLASTALDLGQAIRGLMHEGLNYEQAREVVSQAEHWLIYGKS